MKKISILLTAFFLIFNWTISYSQVLILPNQEDTVRVDVSGSFYIYYKVKSLLPNNSVSFRVLGNSADFDSLSSFPSMNLLEKNEIVEVEIQGILSSERKLGLIKFKAQWFDMFDFKAYAVTQNIWVLRENNQ